MQVEIAIIPFTKHVSSQVNTERYKVSCTIYESCTEQDIYNRTAANGWLNSD